MRTYYFLALRRRDMQQCVSITPCCIPANTRHCPSAGLTLNHRLEAMPLLRDRRAVLITTTLAHPA